MFAAVPTFCAHARAFTGLGGWGLGDGCQPRGRLIPWCEVLEPSEREAVRAALLSLRAVAAKVAGE